MRPQGRGVEQGEVGSVYIIFFLELAQPEVNKLLTTVKWSKFLTLGFLVSPHPPSLGHFCIPLFTLSNLRGPS